MKESRPRTILIIEDNIEILRSLQLVLEEEGYQVECLESGSEIGSGRGTWPKVILLDLLLSGRDGKSICQFLKSWNLTRQIPIILMSANKDLPRIAQEVGADNWIMKPFDTDTLLALLDTYLAREPDFRLIGEA